MRLLALLLLLAAAPAAAAPWDSVTLRWTATGDDSLTGQATEYDLRFSTAPITAANFLAASRWLTMPAPSTSGARDSVTVTGLSPETTYYFALRVADEVPNWSLVSNVVSRLTAAAPDTMPPARVTDLSAP